VTNIREVTFLPDKKGRRQKVNFSAYVLTFNNERTVERCLESVRWADEIVVVDHYSTDHTPEICRRYTERFYQKEWTNYRDEYNYAAGLATHKWVIWLDSDEEISEEPDFENSFPPHCLHGSPGQAKISETSLHDPLLIDPEPLDPDELRKRVREHEGDVLFNKYWFDVFTNPNVGPVLDELDPNVIVVYGVALDVCNRYAVEGLSARRPQTRLAVVTDATRAIVPDRGDALLRRWRERGVALIETSAALGMSGAISEEPAR